MSFPPPSKVGINYLQLPERLRLWANYFESYESGYEYLVRLKSGYLFSNGSNICSEVFLGDLVRQLRKAIPNP